MGALVSMTTNELQILISINDQNYVIVIFFSLIINVSTS